MNTVKTTLLMVAMMGLFLLVGDAIGGQNGMVFAFFFAALMNFSMYWFSDKIVLMMYRAQPVSEQQAPDIYRIVRRLTTTNKMPMPKIYVLPMDTPNAFATGRNPEHAAVAVTSKILQILDENELEAVISHELAHISHRDILISTLVATMAGAIMMLSRMAQFAMIFGGGSRDDNRRGGVLGLLFMAILAPLAAMLIQLAVSRSREYAADEGGARMCGNPLALASALKKLASYSRRGPSNVEPSTAHMFIVNPLSGSVLFKLFSTHPPIEARVKRLEAMASVKIPRVIY